jgi:hypothetical protein
VLDAYRLPATPLHAVFPEGAQPSIKVRLFTEHLIDGFSTRHGDTRFARDGQLTGERARDALDARAR